MIKEKSFTKEMELSILNEWRDDTYFDFVEGTTKEVYSIDTPPPYINSPIHIGHATTYAIMDFIARFRRMMGYEVLFPLGLDQNGLPIEVSAEKRFGVDFTRISRSDAINYCRRVLDETTQKSLDSFFRCGIRFSSWSKGEKISNIYETDSPSYRALTQSTFIDLYNKGLIYEANKVVNWDPKLQTTVADSEIVYENKSGFFHDIVFKVKDSLEEVIIGTTRPELICTCAMVVYNPLDERYQHLKGKILITPYFNKEVLCAPHPIAEIDKGTGLMMMCSYGDLTDIRFFIEQKLVGVIAINKDGTMNENAGPLSGLKIIDARKKMVEELKKEGLLKQMTPTSAHRTPISERSNAEIEFIEVPEFYLKQIEFKDKMKEITNQLNITNQVARQTLIDWIDSVSIDWPISRRRFYATEVPLWYCVNCNKPVLAQKGVYVKPWIEEYKGVCVECGGKKFRGDERVFDTWFDSSISPLYILGYERYPEFFAKNPICSLRPQGKEIIRTWLYYTLLKDYLLTGEIIFRDAWIHQHVVDEKGYKMSKSKGNVIDPMKILDLYGASPFRIWCATEGNLDKSDFKCSLERIGNSAKLLEKLWNVSKFVSMFTLTPEEEEDTELMEVDKWILTELDSLNTLVRVGYTNYDFFNPTNKIISFIKEEFASHYLELVKRRAYNNDPQIKFSSAQRNAAVKTLRMVLKTILEIFSPVNALMNHYLYKELFGGEVHKQEWPTLTNTSTTINGIDLLEFNSLIWKTKKEANLSLKDSIKLVVAPLSLKPIKVELKAMHNILELDFGEETSVTTN